MVKVNFAEVESFKPLEPGNYHFAITDTEVDHHGDNAKHPGNEFWKLTATVQDGPNEGQTQNLTVTLPPYQPITLVNLLRATVGQHEFSDEDVKSGDIDVNIEDLENLEFVATVKKQKNSDFNDVRGYRPYDPESWDPGGDLLP